MAYLHLILNHFPIVGLVIGVIILGVGLGFKSGLSKRIGLYVLIGSLLFSFPVFNSGEGAEEIVEHIPGVSIELIHEHEETAELFMIFVWITVPISLLTLYLDFKKIRYADYFYKFVLILSLIAFFLSQALRWALRWNYTLFLSDVSGSEILLVFVFVLVFFGAKSIPTLAKTLGKLMYQIKNASSEIQQEIKKAGVDIKGDMDLSSFVNESVQEVATPIESSFNEMNQLVNEPIGSKPYVPIAQNEPPVLEVENESNSIDQVDLSEVSKGNTSSVSKE